MSGNRASSTATLHALNYFRNELGLSADVPNAVEMRSELSSITVSKYRSLPAFNPFGVKLRAICSSTGSLVGLELTHLVCRYVMTRAVLREAAVVSSSFIRTISDDTCSPKTSLHICFRVPVIFSTFCFRFSFFVTWSLSPKQ